MLVLTVGTRSPTIGSSENQARIIVAGYDPSDSRARYAAHFYNGSSWNLGSKNNPSSNTSTTYQLPIVATPGISVSSDKVQSIVSYQDGSGNQILRAIDQTGNEDGFSANGGTANGHGFQLSDGTVMLYPSNGQVLRFNSYGNVDDLTSNGFGWYTPGCDHTAGFGLGGNRFVIGTDYSSWANGNTVLILIEIDPTTGEITELDYAPPITYDKGFFPLSSSYCRAWPVWENVSDTTPKYLLLY